MRTTPPKCSCGPGKIRPLPRAEQRGYRRKVPKHLFPFALHLLAVPPIDQTHPEAYKQESPGNGLYSGHSPQVPCRVEKGRKWMRGR